MTYLLTFILCVLPWLIACCLAVLGLCQHTHKNQVIQKLKENIDERVAVFVRFQQHFQADADESTRVLIMFHDEEEAELKEKFAEEIQDVRADLGQQKFHLRGIVSKLDGKGFVNHHGPLETMKAWKQLREMSQ